MNILFIGDIVGSPGRRAVEELLPRLVDQYFIDLVVANGENASGGIGITPQVADFLLGQGIDLLTQVIPVDNILFASEMIGAVRGIDPETGFYYDDTKRYIEATQNLSAEDRHKVYEGNARRVYPRLDAALKAKGK